MKKIVSFVLVLMLLMSVALPALADDPITPRRGRYTERRFELSGTNLTYVEEGQDINDSNEKVNFDTIDRYTLRGYDGFVDIAYRVFFSLDRGAALNMVFTIEMTTPNGQIYTMNDTVEMTYKGAAMWRYAFVFDDMLERIDLDGNLVAGDYDLRLFLGGYLLDEANFYVLP